MTAEEFLAQVDQGVGSDSNTDTLVNDNQPTDEADQFLSQVDLGLEKLNPQTKYATPKTWFGEAKFGLSRGIDSLQQMLYGGAALATTGDLHQKFLQAVKQQDEEIASSPASVPTYEHVDSFDSFMRYFAGGLGEMAPQIGESVAAGAIGAAAGSAAAPGPGTAVGAIGGLIEKQAIRNLIKSGIEEGAKAELRSFATGQIEKKALTETAKSLLVNETKNLGAKYGAFGAIAANSWGQEAASIYTDLEKDSSIPEADKRLSSIVGGFIAAIPDVGFESWIAGKFFKGALNVTKEQVQDASNYAVRFLKTYGKEMLKVIPAEGMQEGAQTLIEEAAKNYADPNKRDAIFNYTEEQKTAAVDAMFKGAIGGVLGGGISAIAETKINPHPNPEVRKDERDILGKANDIAEPAPTKEDIRLSEINQRQEEINAELIKSDTEVTPEQKVTLQTEHAKLEEEANQLLGKETTTTTAEPIVNDNQPETTPIPTSVEGENRPLQEGSPISESKRDVGAFNGKQTPILSEIKPSEIPEREVFARIAPNVTPEEFQAKKDQRDALVNEIVSEHKNPEEAQAYQQAIEQALPDEALIMLAGEGVNILRAEKAGERVAHVGSSATGKINIRLPGVKTLLKQAKVLSEKSGIPITKGDKQSYLRAMNATLTHELVHVADMIATRREWMKGGKKGSYAEFRAQRSVDIGKSIRALGKDLRFKSIFKGLPTLTQQVYNYGDFGSLDNQTLGDEVPRMAAELARTGKIDEFTGALVRLQAESKGPRKGVISTFLQKWMQAIKSIQKVLAKLINPETSSQEFQTAFNNINKVLDQYGVLVNEKAQAQQNEIQKAQKANEDLKSETVDTAAEKAKQTKSLKESARTSEEASILEKTKGKEKDVREEASRPARAAEPKEQQKILSTALNVGGEILKGPEPFSSHQEILAHHGGLEGVIEKTGEVPDLNKQGGFITNENQFVSRKEATEIAKKAGQIPQSYTGELHSQILNEQGGGESIARAAEPVFTKREEKLLKEAADSSNQIRQNQNVIVKPSEPSQRAPQMEFENATPMDLSYQSQTNTSSMDQAQKLVNKNGGALKVAEELLKDSEGRIFNIKEDLYDPLNDSPAPILTATYENVIKQIKHHILPYLQAREAPVKVYIHVQDIWNRLREQFASRKTDLGRGIQNVGFDDKFESGEAAVEELKKAILGSADTVIGKKPQQKMQTIAKEFNALVDEKNAFTAANDPKTLSILRKLIRFVDKNKFAQHYRKEVVKQINKLKAIIGPTAAKAAEAMGNSDSSFSKADKVMEYIIKQMTLDGIKDPSAPDEHSVVLTALAKMARNIAKDMGLIEDHPTFAKLTPQQKMLAILKNEDLYTYFINGLREEQINKFGNEKDANELFAKMSNRMWEPGIVTAIVNEKLREINETFADIVKKDYEKGDFVKGNITNEIRDYMEKNGVKNEALVEELVNDIEKQFEENINAAREKSFTSNKSLREAMRFLGTTVAEAARDFYKNSENLQGGFADYLVEMYSFPEMEARLLANVMQKALNPLVNETRTAILENYYKSWIRQQEAEKKRKLNPNEIKKFKGATERILELANLGVMRSETVYKALQEKFGLPEYSQETADKIQELGDQIGESKSERQANELKQILSNYITSVKGLPTSSSYLSWMYYSMLFGIGTFAVNAGGNNANLMGYLAVEAIKNPAKIPRMLGAMMRAASGSGVLEAKYSWFTGMQIGKDGAKFFTSKNPLELPDVRFNSDTFLSKFGEKGKELDEKLAGYVHKVARGVKGQYIGRALAATDIYFYKIAQEMAYAARVDGDLVGTPDMWASAKDQAREEMLLLNRNPDGTTKERNEFQVKANAIFEEMRLQKDPDKITAWRESHGEALKSTFNQEPEYFLGRIQKHVERILEGSIIGKAIVPFTKISANVTNAMLEWTPFGIARYLLVQEGNPFKPLEDGKFKKDADIAIRAILGTGMMFALMALMKDDEDDPNGFTIYGDGPRDLQKKRLLMERGWKPHTFRVAGNYYSYLYMPWAMAFSIVGRRMDDHRDGKLDNPYGVQMATDAVAMMQATLHQSFLSSLTDLTGAIDSPDPEAKISKVLARMSSIPVPNIVKQIDRWIDPSLQDAHGFTESIIKEFPIARYALNPALNVFGEPIKRTTTLIPGLERFVTGEKTSDEVLNLLSEKNISVPGYSKSTRIGNVGMTEEQYYRYVQIAGPKIKQRIQSELGSLRMMTREQIQDRIEKIATEEKKRARAELTNSR